MSRDFGKGNGKLSLGRIKALRKWVVEFCVFGIMFTVERVSNDSFLQSPWVFPSFPLRGFHSPSPGCPVRKHGEDQPPPKATARQGWRQATAAYPAGRSWIGFGVVPLGFATDAPRGSAGSFTLVFGMAENG